MPLFQIAKKATIPLNVSFQDHYWWTVTNILVYAVSLKPRASTATIKKSTLTNPSSCPSIWTTRIPRKTPANIALQTLAPMIWMITWVSSVTDHLSWAVPSATFLETHPTWTTTTKIQKFWSTSKCNWKIRCFRLIPSKRVKIWCVLSSTMLLYNIRIMDSILRRVCQLLTKIISTQFSSST